MLSSTSYQKSYNRRSVVVSTAPSGEPLDLVDAKQALRVADSADDAMITRQIKAAREAVESYLSRKLITQTLTLTLDAFPHQVDSLDVEEPVRTLAQGSINLPMGPVQSITSMSYFDTADVEQTIDPSLYTLDIAGERILLESGQSWPTGARSRAAIKIVYVVGYGAAAAVPASIVEAINQIVCRLYESRGCCGTDEAIASCSGILSPYRQRASYGRTW